MRDIDKSKEQLIAELAEARHRIRELELVQIGEKNYYQFLKSLHEGIWVLDKDDCTTFVNPRMAEMLGYTEEEMLGRPVFSFMDTEWVKTTTVHMQRRKQGITEQIDAELLRKDGGRVYALLEASPILDDNGNYVGSIAGIQDITERRQVEEERVEKAAAQARTEELQRSRRRIVTAQESIRRDIAQQLHGAVQNRLVILTHKLAELEKDASQMELAKQLSNMRHNLSELLENYLRPIAYQLYPSILRRGLVAALQSMKDRLELSMLIEMKIDDDLLQQERHNHAFIPEPVRLAAHRIIEEALGNALKHAEASKIVIGLKSSPEGLLCLTVRDNGQGFDVESVSGGLGILFMRDYAELVGGKCVISSTSGNGTEIAATLPLVKTDEERPERASPSE